MNYLRDELPSWIFIFDILMNFNTAFFKNGVIIDQRKRIFKRYYQGIIVTINKLKIKLIGKLFLDLLIVIPFIFSLNLNIPYLEAILMLRVF